MARTIARKHKVSTINEIVSMNGFTNVVDVTEGAEIGCDIADHKQLVLVYNGSADTAAEVTVLAGNGLQGVADLKSTLEPQTYAIMCLESGRFKNVTGEDKGKIILKASTANVQIAVFMLP